MSDCQIEGHSLSQIVQLHGSVVRVTHMFSQRTCPYCQLASVQAENKMLRDNTAMRINGTDEIAKLQAELEATRQQLADSKSISSQAIGHQGSLMETLKARAEASEQRAVTAEREKTEIQNEAMTALNKLRDRIDEITKERDELKEEIESREGDYKAICDYASEMRTERDKLREEVERLKSEKSLLAKEMLNTLAGIVCTPVEGYDCGRFGWMVSDVRTLRKLAETLQTENAALRQTADKYRKVLKKIVNTADADRGNAIELAEIAADAIKEEECIEYSENSKQE